MAGTWTKLELYEDWDYRYTVVLEGQSYVLRLYYSERMGRWSIDISEENGVDICLGEALLPYKKHTIRAGYGLSGYLWLEPIAYNLNETTLHPDLLHKYYNFYYILEE